MTHVVVTPGLGTSLQDAGRVGHARLGVPRSGPMDQLHHRLALRLVGQSTQPVPGAVAIEVERSRFLPVKTTNDLLLIRSDVYEVADTGIIKRNVSEAPTIHLDPEHFAHIDQFETRAQHVPSLIEARSLTVTGDYTFPEGLVIRGDATLP